MQPNQCTFAVHVDEITTHSPRKWMVVNTPHRSLYFSAIRKMTSHEYACVLGNIIFFFGRKISPKWEIFFRAATPPTKVFFLKFDKTIHQKSRVFGLGLLDVECLLLQVTQTTAGLHETKFCPTCPVTKCGYILMWMLATVAKSQKWRKITSRLGTFPDFKSQRWLVPCAPRVADAKLSAVGFMKLWWTNL
jgi:hypothetical protein